MALKFRGSCGLGFFLFFCAELPEHAPVVYEPLSDVTGFEGSRVQLSCKIIGKPVPFIQWCVLSCFVSLWQWQCLRLCLLVLSGAFSCSVLLFFFCVCVCVCVCYWHLLASSGEYSVSNLSASVSGCLLCCSGAL